MHNYGTGETMGLSYFIDSITELEKYFETMDSNYICPKCSSKKVLLTKLQPKQNEIRIYCWDCDEVHQIPTGATERK